MVTYGRGVRFKKKLSSTHRLAQMLLNSTVEVTKSRANVRCPTRGTTKLIYHSRLTTFRQSVLVPKERTDREGVDQNNPRIHIGVEFREQVKELTLQLVRLQTEIRNDKISLKFWYVKGPRGS